MKTILITGGGGFIGSNLVAELAGRGTHRLVVCDRFGTGDKWRNLAHHIVWEIIDPDQALDWLAAHRGEVEAVFHIGGVSSTTERDIDLILKNNLSFSLALWRFCAREGIRFLYTSSAAAYGAGEHGFDDDFSLEYLRKLNPLSGYGWSKHLFDLHIAQNLAQGEPRPPQWAGLRLFNVYGPNEYHKELQRSVITQIAEQAIHAGHVRLFRSYRPDIRDGEQMRDVVYVKDCTRALAWLLDRPEVNGLYNFGSGKARSFNDMARAIFAAIGREPRLNYIDMPEGLVHKYQYFTEARMDRLRDAGYTAPTTSLEDGTRDFVQNHLLKPNPYH